jgi:hypothetical protein
MKALRIIAVIVGALLVAAGLAGLAAGATLAVAHSVLRDDDGFLNSRTRDVETATSAVVGRVDLTDLPDDVWPDDMGTVKVSAEGTDRPIFIGVAPTDQVSQWLGTSPYARVIGVRSVIETQREGGSGALPPPTSQTFWTASSSGIGQQHIVWQPQPGDWTFVVANADGQPGVSAAVKAGVKANLLPASGIVAIAGLAMLAVGVIIMLAAVGRDGIAGPPAPAAALAGGYPARLDGQLDPGLSRWMWLVKWFLAIPHVFVLSLLWLAVVPLTVIAGIVVLVTGRYPLAIFRFNTGVIRWSWRVSYYAFNVLGTDRYPPFSLDSDPGYPADFAVDYPQRLSRGLVLVKWWLLAIPHYLIVGIFLGSWQLSGGIGLIGILVLIAVVILLFTSRYHRDLYDFVMGLNRWCYRVLAYVMLLRDEYPPFRLDTGGHDPATAQPVDASLPGSGTAVDPRGQG